MAGRKIDDHSFWAGKPPKGCVFPEGAKVKDESGVEGSGSVMRYEDTSEAIRDVQDESVSKAEKHRMKEGYRY